MSTAIFYTEVTGAACGVQSTSQLLWPGAKQRIDRTGGQEHSVAHCIRQWCQAIVRVWANLTIEAQSQTADAAPMLKSRVTSQVSINDQVKTIELLDNPGEVTDPDDDIGDVVNFLTGIVHRILGASFE